MEGKEKQKPSPPKLIKNLLKPTENKILEKDLEPSVEKDLGKSYIKPINVDECDDIECPSFQPSREVKPLPWLREPKPLATVTHSNHIFPVLHQKKYTPGGHHILPLASSVRANTHQFPFNRQPVAPTETFMEPRPESIGVENRFEEAHVSGPTVATQQSHINAHQIMLNFPELQVSWIK